MEYKELAANFDKGVKIYFKTSIRNTNEKWKLVTSKEQLYSIHNYVYQIENSENDNQKVIEKLISFVENNRMNKENFRFL